MISDSPPRVGSAAARSDTHSTEAASVSGAGGTATGAVRPPTPKLAQRFVNPVAQREKAAERVARAHRRKSRVMRSPPQLSLSKETLEGVAAFGLLVRSVHSKSCTTAFPNATVVDPSKVPRSSLKGTSLSWLPAVCSSKVKAPIPLPHIVAKCLTKKRPTPDELLQIQSSEAIRASISIEAAALNGSTLLQANKSILLTSLEPKTAAADLRVPYGMEPGFSTSYFFVAKGIPKKVTRKKKRNSHIVGAEVDDDTRDVLLSHRTDENDDDDDDDDDDEEYRPHEEELFDRGDGFNDIGEHNEYGKRNLCTLPHIRAWQHENIPKLKMAVRSCDEDAVENIKTLLDSPRSVFVLAEAGVLPHGLGVSTNPQTEGQRRRLMHTLQEKYIRMTHKVSQEDFIQLVCAGDRPHSAANSVSRNRQHSSVQRGESIFQESSTDLAPLPEIHSERFPASPSKYSTLSPVGGGGGASNVARPLKQFREHTKSLTATWSHQQELAAKRLAKEQRSAVLIQDARKRKVLISRAMQSAGSLAQVRALEATAHTPPPISPRTAMSGTSPSALMILPRCGSFASEGTRPVTSQQDQRNHHYRPRPHSCCSNCSSNTYRSDDDNLFLENESDDEIKNEQADPNAVTIGSGESIPSASKLAGGDVSASGARGWSPNSGARAEKQQDGQNRLTPLETVRLQHKEAEKKRIADAEAALERKEQAAAAAMEKLRLRRDAQKHERILRSKEVQDKNQRTKRVIAFESLQLVNKQEYKAKAAAKRHEDEMNALHRRSENAMRSQLVAHEAKAMIGATEKQLQKDMFALEVHAHTVDDLLHSREAQSPLIRRIHDERDKEREWRRRHLLDKS